MFKISIPYKIIVTDEDLCNDLWVNPNVVNEWLVDWDDMLTVDVSWEELWLVTRVMDYLMDNEVW